MQVILSEDVEHLGHTGDIVIVKDGYGRNYLIPRGMAVAANPKNVAQFEHNKKVIAAKEAKNLANAASLKAKLESLEVTISKPVGEDDKLFGSVTTRDVADAINAKDVEIDRKKISIETPIKSVGEHKVNVKLGREMNAEVKVWVVAS